MTLLLNIDVPDVETGVRFYTAACANIPQDFSSWGARISVAAAL
jgi:hypothetical protein